MPKCTTYRGWLITVSSLLWAYVLVWCLCKLCYCATVRAQPRFYCGRRKVSRIWVRRREAAGVQRCGSLRRRLVLDTTPRATTAAAGKLVASGYGATAQGVYSGASGLCWTHHQGRPLCG